MIELPHQKSPKSPFNKTGYLEGEYFSFPELCHTSISSTKLQHGGIEKILPSEQIIKGNIQNFGFEYIISGSCTVTHNNKKYKLVAGSILPISKFDDYYFEVNSTETLKKAYFSFTGKLAESSEAFADFFKVKTPFRLHNIEWIYQALRQTVDCAQLPNDETDQLCEILMDYFIRRVNIEKSQEKKNNSHALNTFIKIKSYIENNYLEISRINEVSKACFLSLPHLSRLFKKYSNEKPSEMLNRLKLEKAAHMLSTGKYMIKEVSDYIGFEDALYFSSRFKKHFGVSPKFYNDSVIAEYPKEIIRKAS